MKLFRKKPEGNSFIEDTLDGRFAELMSWVKDLSDKDYDRLLEAVAYGRKAYQALRGVKGGGDTTIAMVEYELTKEKGGKK